MAGQLSSIDCYRGGYTICSWKGGENMCRDEYVDDSRDRDIHFLFETEKWNGNKIENMQPSHIINTLLMLKRRATEFKLNYELFVIDNMNNKLLVPKDNINDLAKRPAGDWIIETPIYIALLEELEKRKLEDYFDIVAERIKETEKSE